MKSRRNRRAKIKFFLNEIANQDGKPYCCGRANYRWDEPPIQSSIQGGGWHCGRAPGCLCVKGQPSGSMCVLRPTVEIRLIIGTGNFVYLSMYWNVWTCVLPRGPRHMGLPSSGDGVWCDPDMFSFLFLRIQRIHTTMYTSCRRSCRVCRCIPGIPCGSATGRVHS